MTNTPTKITFTLITLLIIGCNADSIVPSVSVCGDGLISEGEICDSDCPTHCNDGNACTVGTLSGAAESCTSSCTYVDISACAHGDGCCAPSCDLSNDNDCAPTCGDGVVSEGEICDGDCPVDCDDANACTVDVAFGALESCDAYCSHELISNCVDGDGCCADGCNISTDSDCPVVCGDGVISEGETCDGACHTDWYLDKTDIALFRCTHKHLKLKRFYQETSLARSTR